MALEDIVSVAITIESAQVDQASFSIPLVAAYHTNWTDRTRTYSASSALSTMVSEGFSTSSQAYRLVAKILSANPRVRTVMIGRRDGAWQQITRIVPVAANSFTYSVAVNGTAATFTSDGSATVAEVCTGLAAAIDALPLVTASGVSGTHVDVTTTAVGTLAKVVLGSANLSLLDVTADADIADDLTAIRAASTAWYALLIDSNATAEILEAADWTESQKAIFFAQSADSGILDPASTTDIADDLHALAYKRTSLLYHADQTAGAAARWVGEVLVTDPGEATWAFKTLSGIEPSVLTENQIGSLKAKGANYYITLGGRNVTLDGVMVDGNMWIDNAILVDWAVARVTERVFALLVSQPKLPYSDRSVNLVLAEILAVLQQGVQNGGFLAGGDGIVAPFATGPKVADVADADKAARHLPDIHFGATIAGAIHSVAIAGKLSV